MSSEGSLKEDRSIFRSVDQLRVLLRVVKITVQKRNGHRNKPAKQPTTAPKT